MSESATKVIQPGDKFIDAGGTWEVLNVRPFGQLSLICRKGADRGLIIEETHSRIRALWERLS